MFNKKISIVTLLFAVSLLLCGCSLTFKKTDDGKVSITNDLYTEKLPRLFSFEGKEKHYFAEDFSFEYLDTVYTGYAGPWIWNNQKMEHIGYFFDITGKIPGDIPLYAAVGEKDTPPTHLYYKESICKNSRSMAGSQLINASYTIPSPYQVEFSSIQEGNITPNQNDNVSKISVTLDDAIIFSEKIESYDQNLGGKSSTIYFNCSALNMSIKADVYKTKTGEIYLQIYPGAPASKYYIPELDGIFKASDLLQKNELLKQIPYQEKELYFTE